MFESLGEGIQLWDADGQLIYANAETDRHFNLPPGQRGISQAMLAAQCLNENGLPVTLADCPVNRVLAHGETRVLALVQSPSASGMRWLQITAMPYLADMAGQATGAISLSVDVTSLKKEGLDLERHAYYDPLTRLPNRLLFADRLQLALAQSQRHDEGLAVCLLDLDGFKPVNDQFGHKAGDQLLQEIAHRLQEVLRRGDTAARIGGDEFALLIGGLKSIAQCEQTLQRLLHAVEMPLVIEGHPVRVSASIGVTMYPTDAVNPDQLLRHADKAMYQAKEAGKGRFHMFDPTIESQMRAKQGLLRKIEDALDRGQFALHYQPKVDCLRGKVVGFEALIRWDHPVLGMRAPAEFLPLIENDDLIVRLGEWVIAEALRQLDEWRRAGIDTRISVNVSARQFLRGNFDLRLGELLRAHAPETRSHLEIEIVETAALEDINAVSRVISAYADLGVRFALDDFGTGYSSLVHLKRLAAHQLKIDQTFIRDMLDDPGDLAIVQGIVGLASAFQQSVVAEGVESIEQILLLLELGCDVMQGYAIARPMTAQRVPGWLAGFSSDPRWRAAGQHYPQRSDFELLLMEVAHRHWIERLLVAAGSGAPLPAIAYAECRLAQWHAKTGLERHGHLPEFHRLDELHREVHRLADVLQATVHDHRDAMTHDVRAELVQANQRLVAGLHQFRIAIATEQT